MVLLLFMHASLLRGDIIDQLASGLKQVSIKKTPPPLPPKPVKKVDDLIATSKKAQELFEHKKNEFADLKKALDEHQAVALVIVKCDDCLETLKSFGKNEADKAAQALRQKTWDIFNELQIVNALKTIQQNVKKELAVEIVTKALSDPKYGDIGKAWKKLVNTKNDLIDNYSKCLAPLVEKYPEVLEKFISKLKDIKKTGSGGPFFELDGAKNLSENMCKYTGSYIGNTAYLSHYLNLNNNPLAKDFERFLKTDSGLEYRESLEKILAVNSSQQQVESLIKALEPAWEYIVGSKSNPEIKNKILDVLKQDYIISELQNLLKDPTFYQVSEGQLQAIQKLIKEFVALDKDFAEALGEKENKDFVAFLVSNSTIAKKLLAILKAKPEDLLNTVAKGDNAKAHIRAQFLKNDDIMQNIAKASLTQDGLKNIDTFIKRFNNEMGLSGWKLLSQSFPFSDED